MPLHNFRRPQLPYDNQSLQNDDRFQVLTRTLGAPPTDIMIDSELNYLLDGLNTLDQDIQGVVAGTIPGANVPANANLLVTTDGNGNLSWVPVTNENCQDGSISGTKLIDSSVTEVQIANGAITNDKMAGNAIGTNNLIDLSVTTNKLGGLAVTNAKLAALSVDSTKIQINAIRTGHIQDFAITTAKIANQQVTAAQIANNTITAAQIANQTITETQMANNSIGTNQLVDASVTLPKIGAGVLTPAAVKADQITGTSTTVYTNPAVQQYHPSSCKFYCSFLGFNPGTNAPTEGYNVTSVTMNSDGNWTINFTVPFTTTTYAVNVTCSLNAGQITVGFIRSQATGSVSIGAALLNGDASNPTFITVTGYGIQ